MQKVHRLFLTLTIFMGLGLSTYAQCVPDTTTPGIPALYPDTLMNGKQGQPYDQVITIVIPQDTAVDIGLPVPFELDICSLVLDSIVGLPKGLSYSCNTPDCIWEVNHEPGVINRGCVQITGIPQDTVPNDTLSVFANVIPGQFDSVVDTCALLLPGLIPDSLTQVEYRPRFFIEKDSSFVSIEDYKLHHFGLNVYPNPSRGKAMVEFTLPERTEVAIRLTDIMGRQVQTLDLKAQNAGSYQHEIGSTNLPKGIYLVSINLGNGLRVLTRKLVIE